MRYFGFLFALSALAMAITGCEGFRGYDWSTTGSTGSVVPTSASLIFRNKTAKSYYIYYIEGQQGSVLNCTGFSLEGTINSGGSWQKTVPANRTAWIRFQESTESAGCASRFNKFETHVITDKAVSEPIYYDIN